MFLLAKQGSLIFLVAAFLTGCATPAPLDFTVQDVGIVNSRLDAELETVTVGFAPQNQQRKLETNETLPPIWKEGLLDALARSLAFTDGADTRVNVSVRITEADAPAFGAAMTSGVGAIYEVINRSNGDIIFSEEIRTEGVVPMGYAMYGPTRARESVNRAVRKNIAAFIQQLGTADVDSPKFPAGK